MKKDTNLNIRINSEVKKNLQNKADKYGLSLADYLVMVALNANIEITSTIIKKD